MDKDKPSAAAQIVLMLISLAGTAMIVWSQMPPQERYWLQLRTAGALRGALLRVARTEGRAGMADELAGRDPMPRYGVAYHLMRWQDVCTRRLDSMRP